MPRLLFRLLIFLFGLRMYHALSLDGCRFAETFYKIHSSVFELDQDRRSLTIRPLFTLTNQSYSSIEQPLSIGIIYRLAETHLVPVPLLFECPHSTILYSPTDCQFTIVDARSTDLPVRTTEYTRTTTVPLHFNGNSIPLRGAYFKQSTIAIRNCRFAANEYFLSSDTFHLNIEFEQIIGTTCRQTCNHHQLYQCSSLTNTCQCQSRETGIESFGHLCIDTELGSNCSRTPERCRRVCRIAEQIRTKKIDSNCQCPTGTRRVLINQVYRCELPILAECDEENLSTTMCPLGYICRQNRCMHTSMATRVDTSTLSLPFVLVGLLVGALLIIVVLVLGLIKMRSVRCIKFVHPSSEPPNTLSSSASHSGNSSPATVTRLSTVHSSSSPCSTLSSSSKKSTKLSTRTNTPEKYTKIDLFM